MLGGMGIFKREKQQSNKKIAALFPVEISDEEFLEGTYLYLDLW